MNRKYIFVSIFAFVFSFFFLTFGFCAFTSDLTINDVGVTVRQPLDVRVTNVTLNNSTGGASVENLDYNVRSVMSDITLPENSSITYNLEFTNYSNFSVYLLEITNLPDNLKYEIDVGKSDKYSLKDLFIENQYELKEITVTLSYKDNGYSSENECYSINLGFYFDTSYNVLFHSNNLPFEYQQVEYIESTGTQYIDTQVLSENNDLKFEIQYEIVKFSLQNQYVGIFGAYRSEQDNTTRLIYNSVTDTTGNALVYVNSIANGSALIDDTYRSTNIVYTDVIEKKHQTTFYTSNAFDGVKEKSDLVNGASYSDNIVIFNHSPNSHIYASMKLYYFKIYDAGGLIRYFIPCYRKSDGEIGLYDVVGNKFVRRYLLVSKSDDCVF